MKSTLVTFAANPNAQELLAKSRGGSSIGFGGLVLIIVLAVLAVLVVKAINKRRNNGR